MPDSTMTPITLLADGTPAAAGDAKTAQKTSRGSGFTKVIPLDQNEARAMGRFKPTIHWYTPILMILAFAVLVGALTWIIRRIGRKAEKANWHQAAMDDAYSDTPFRTTPRDSSS